MIFLHSLQWNNTWHSCTAYSGTISDILAQPTVEQYVTFLHSLQWNNKWHFAVSWKKTLLYIWIFKGYTKRHTNAANSGKSWRPFFKSKADKKMPQSSPLTKIKWHFVSNHHLNNNISLKHIFHVQDLFMVYDHCLDFGTCSASTTKISPWTPLKTSSQLVLLYCFVTFNSAYPINPYKRVPPVIN